MTQVTEEQLEGERARAKVEKVIAEAKERNAAMPAMPTGESETARDVVIDNVKYAIVRLGLSRKQRRAFMSTFNRHKAKAKMKKK